MSIARNFLKGSFFNTANFFIQIAVVFFITPILIGALGERHYGFWILIVSIVGYSAFFDFGISSSVARYASRAWGQNDDQEVRAIVAVAFRLFSLIGLFILVVALLVAAFGPRFLENEREGSLFQFAIILLGLGAAMSFPVKAFLGLLKAFVRIDLMVAATLARFLTANALIYFFLTRGHGLMTLAVITFATTLIEYVLVYLFARKLLPGKILSVGANFKEIRGKLFQYSKYAFCIQFCGSVKTRFDPLIIAGLLSVSLVAYYAIAMRLLQYFIELVGSLMGGGIMSIFSRYEGQDRQDLLQKRLVEATKVSSVFAVFIAGSILFYGEAFLLRWLGPSFFVSYDLLILLTVPFALCAIQIPGVFLLYGISEHKPLALWMVGEAVFNVSLKLVLAWLFGLTGFAIAVAIEMTISNLIIHPLLFCRSIHLPAKTYYMDSVLIPSAKTLLLLLPFFFLTHGFLAPSYPQLAGLGFLQFLLAPFAIYLVMGRANVQMLIKEIIGFRKNRQAPASE